MDTAGVGAPRPDRDRPPGRGPAPPAAGAHAAFGHARGPLRRSAGAPRPGPPGPGRAWPTSTGGARGGRRLEDRPAHAHLSPGGEDLLPCRGRAGQSEPDGSPTEALQGVCDALIEAQRARRAQSRRRPRWPSTGPTSSPSPPGRPSPTGTYADEEAAWGHRKGGGPGEKDELFFGYYLSLATMVHDEAGREVPELVRRMHSRSCDHDPVPVMTDVLVSMAAAGMTLRRRGRRLGLRPPGAKPLRPAHCAERAPPW